jgi:thioredoxin-dependent peroxiredoxin
MAQTKLGDAVVNTIASLPEVGTPAPEFSLTGNDLKDIHSKDFIGRSIVLNIYPSVDTRVCATSTRVFNKQASSFKNTVIICVAKDLPFAFKRFCDVEGIDKIITASDFRFPDFGKKYGVELIDGGFKGLLARAIVVIGADGVIKHTELVSSIGQEPDYEAALRAI